MHVVYLLVRNMKAWKVSRLTIMEKLHDYTRITKAEYNVINKTSDAAAKRDLKELDAIHHIRK